MLQKALNTQRPCPRRGSSKCLDYNVLLHSFCACPSSLRPPHPQQTDRNCLFLHTSSSCAGYSHRERLQQAAPAPRYGRSTEERQWLRFHWHLQRGSHAREPEGQAGWGRQDLSQNKYAVPSNAELLSTLQELLSCRESASSSSEKFWEVLEPLRRGLPA